MRLYKAELYKLCYKKIFSVGLLFILGFVLLYFFQNLLAETSTVDGVTYHGYEAVQMDRQITEEFKGPLTDEKMQQIIDRYGFPQKFEPYIGLTDSNFLNEFVMRYASDGYTYDWDDYRLPTKVVPLADTEQGRLITSLPDSFQLTYYAGWENFTAMYHTEMILISVLLLCVLSPIFSHESQSRMKPLLFTTQEGPASDVSAKIAASLTLCAVLWLLFTVLNLLLYGTVYGWDGLRCNADLVTFGHLSYPGSFQILQQPLGTYLLIVMLFSLTAVLELCAITLAISAGCRSSFHTVFTAALCWIIPVFLLLIMKPALIRFLSSLGLSHSLLRVFAYIVFLSDCMLYAAPFYMIYDGILEEISVMNRHSEILPLYIVFACACIIFALCIASTYHRYRKQECR